MFVVCLLALSVSLDTLGIGMAYAMSGICIPKRIRLFIALLNGVLTAVALFVGSTCLAGLPEPCFRLVGGGILILLGAKTCIRVLQNKGEVQYDKDNSRSIDIKEGSALGSALALDSVSAALSLVGQGTIIWLFPVCTAFLCGAFLWIGGQRIYHVRRLKWNQWHTSYSSWFVSRAARFFLIALRAKITNRTIPV